MDFFQLTACRLDNLFEHLAPLMSNLAKLRKRIDTSAFPKDDELARLVSKAHAVAHMLSVHVHDIKRLREPGVEPGPLAGLDPKSSASANSATLAKGYEATVWS